LTEQSVPVTTYIPEYVDEVIEKLCYIDLGAGKVKVRNKTDVVRELIVLALIQKGLIEGETKGGEK
jgi:hypothetical protein